MAYAWYRLRSTMRSELSYFLTVILLVGAVGGLALGAIEAARSTDSSFADFVTSSHVPQLFVFDGVINPGIGLNSAYNPELLRTLSHLPDVERVESTVELNMGPLTRSGKPLPESVLSPTAEASVGGLDFNEDPITVTDGRIVDPHRADEVVVDAASAKALGYHLGEKIPVGWVTNAADPSGNFNPNQAGPGPSAGVGDARRDHLRAGDDAVRGPRQRQRPVDHALRPGTDEQAPHLLQQRHDQRADAEGWRPPPLDRGGSGEARAPERSPVRLRGVAEHHRDGQRHSAPGDDRPQCLRRHHRDRRPAHRRAGDQSSGPPPRTGPRHRPGPRSGPPDVPVGQPPRFAWCPAARFVARRRRGRGPLAARATRTGAASSSAWRSDRTGR